MKSWLLCAFACSLIISGASVAKADPHRKPCRDTEVRCFIRKYWGADDSEALTVAKCESDYDPNAQTGQFRGVFQLGEHYHRARAERLGYTWNDMRDSGKNTRVAYSLYKDSGWGPWSCRP